MVSKLTQVLIASIFFLISLSVHAHTNINRIVVFGDSLSDNGNLYQYSGLPEKPYFNGHFSNGPVWIELLASTLQLDTTSKKQFVDYAFGGAWAADSQNNEGGLVPLSFERNLYLGDYPSHTIDESNTLFVMWIGNNDYLQDGRLQENPNAVVDNTISAIRTHIEKLIDTNEGAGAKHFLILNLPDLGQTPKALEAIKHGHADYAANISLLAKMHNQQLAALTKELASKYPDVEFISFDLAGHFDDLVQHPENYQINNVATPCFIEGFGYQDPNSHQVQRAPVNLTINNRVVNMTTYPDLLKAYHEARDGQQQQQICSTPNTYLFWDYVHPTAHAHTLISHFIAEMLANAKRV